MVMVGDGVRLFVDMSQYASVGWHHSIRDARATRKDAQQNAEIVWRTRRLSMLVSTGLMPQSVNLPDATLQTLLNVQYSPVQDQQACFHQPDNDDLHFFQHISKLAFFR